MQFRIYQFLLGIVYALGGVGSVGAVTITTTTADATPSNGAVALTVNFSGGGTDVVLYEWDFEGDGTFDFSSAFTGNTSHTYATVGTYVAIFRVTDSNGVTDTARTTQTRIDVGPAGSPSVTASATPSSGPNPLTVSLNATASGGGGAIVLYEWDFDFDGTFDFSSAFSAATSHVFSSDGVFSPMVRVTNDQGLASADTIEVCVACTVVAPPLPDTPRVPEPSTLVLLGLGLAGFGFARRRKLN